MAKSYSGAHVLSRFTAYRPTGATWHLMTSTRQLKQSAPLTRHHAVVLLDQAGKEVERIVVTALTYASLRRLAHDTLSQAALPHTPDVLYDYPVRVISLKRQAHDLLQEATRLREQVQGAVDYVQQAPNPSLGLADDYLRGATVVLHALAIAQETEAHI